MCAPCACSRCAETGACTARGPCAAVGMADRGCALAGSSLAAQTSPSVPGYDQRRGGPSAGGGPGGSPSKYSPTARFPRPGAGPGSSRTPPQRFTYPHGRCVAPSAAVEVRGRWECSGAKLQSVVLLAAPTPDSCCLPLSVPPDLACPCPPFLASSPTSVPCYARLVRPANTVLHRMCHAEEPARRGASAACSWS
jgi:hypothetical protein